MLSQDTEPEIIYRTSFMRHLQIILSLRIKFSDSVILLYDDDDVKGSLRHSDFYPDVVSAFHS